MDRARDFESEIDKLRDEVSLHKQREASHHNAVTEHKETVAELQVCTGWWPLATAAVIVSMLQRRRCLYVTVATGQVYQRADG